MICYEWVIETVDAYNDITDVNHADTFQKAARDAASIKLEDGERVEIGLVRDRIDPFDDNLEDRQWAYLEDGKLPAKFDGGAAVPARFITEVERGKTL